MIKELETTAEAQIESNKDTSTETKSPPKTRYYLIIPFDELETFNQPEQRIAVERTDFKKNELMTALDPKKFPPTTALKVKQPLLSGTPLIAVTNSKEICVFSETMNCKQKEVTFELDVAVAMRKGSAKPPTPKAMGEDAFVLDKVDIDFNGKNYQIPIMATLDGGGGHTLAQFGRENIKSAFEKNLDILIKVEGKLDSSIICRAMKKTDDELFERFDANGKPTFKGSGYTKLIENHDEVKKKYSVPLDEFAFKKFKEVFQGLTLVSNTEKKLQLNPMEIHLQLNDKNSDINPIISIFGRDYDLRNENEAKELQSYYEKCLGTEADIEVQMVMNAFFVNENNELECVTYNRGDSMAMHVGSEKTTALSKSVSNAQSNQSLKILQDGDRVISMCDGVKEVISIEEIQEANNSELLNKKSSEDYVTTFMQASVHTGSGDDKTLISAKVKFQGS